MLTAPTRHITVRALPDEQPAVAGVLARAFYDDPVFMHLLPDDASRLQRSEQLFAGMLLRAAAPHDEVHTTHEHTGAAIWFPPGHVHLSVLQQLRYLPTMVRVGRRDLPRILRCMTTMEEQHPHEPHFYLNILGTDPERQGEGIGSALLRAVLDRCDDEGIPAYLEATSPRNAGLYERHGFRTTGEIVLPDGPTMWAMWRDA
ncbi:GNAT family N-acetyltransferase [Svornostia abyssi]|uniref:GNAT family N-acetyltransferase n=1 Tax=Svornostia abyssi TaxID=2898438 RepID=A0ABY5PH75_9ACTN|nr:GNAT family N-acetyltransferase [Parviterribacteraceae bacterium J379]